MTISMLRKGNFRCLASTIASTLISTVGIFAAIDIDNRAKGIVVTGDPNDYIVSPGTGYDGVVLLVIDKLNTTPEIDATCTGSLLPTGLHILTAAHCLTQNLEDVDVGRIPGKFNTRIAAAYFELPTLLPTQPYVVPATEFFVYPDWNGIQLNGSDIAIIKLADSAPQEADRYDIYRNTDELGQVVTIVGYGQSGNGNTGATIPVTFPGGKRSGQNTYEFFLKDFLDAANPMNVDVSNAARDTVLGYDFDNGLAANDLFGYLGIPNTGLGLNEVNTAGGDSGGPEFINGLIAGISSFEGNAQSVPPDIDNVRNSSFGEFSFSTRVSSYASYIDDVLAGKIAPTYTVPLRSSVPEPSTVVGSMLTLGALAINSHFRRRAKKKKAIK